MSRTKIVLKQPVDNLGEIGDVVTVAGGYARNYLIPRGIAVPATKGNVRQAEVWSQSKAAKAAKQVSEARAIQARLEAEPLSIGAQAGPDGQLFGSITPAQIVEAIAQAHEVAVDRQGVELAEPIRHLGHHEVRIPLHPEVTALVTVEAVAEGS